MYTIHLVNLLAISAFCLNGTLAAPVLEDELPVYASQTAQTKVLPAKQDYRHHLEPRQRPANGGAVATTGPGGAAPTGWGNGRSFDGGGIISACGGQGSAPTAVPTSGNDDGGSTADTTNLGGPSTATPDITTADATTPGSGATTVATGESTDTTALSEPTAKLKMRSPEPEPMPWQYVFHPFS